MPSMCHVVRHERRRFHRLPCAQACDLAPMAACTQLATHALQAWQRICDVHKRGRAVRSVALTHNVKVTEGTRSIWFLRRTRMD